MLKRKKKKKRKKGEKSKGIYEVCLRYKRQYDGWINTYTEVDEGKKGKLARLCPTEKQKEKIKFILLLIF